MTAHVRSYQYRLPAHLFERYAAAGMSKIGFPSPRAQQMRSRLRSMGCSDRACAGALRTEPVTWASNLAPFRECYNV